MAAAAAMAGLPGASARRGPGGPRSCGCWCWRSAGRASACPGSCRGTSSSPASRHSKPASCEDAVEALGLGLLLHQAAARHDQRPHAGGDLAALDDAGGGADILDPAVGAGADEDDVDRQLRRSAGPASGPYTPACAALGAARPRRRPPPGSGTLPVIGSTSSGLVPQVTCGAISSRVERHHACRRCAPGSVGRVRQ